MFRQIPRFEARKRFHMLIRWGRLALDEFRRASRSLRVLHAVHSVGWVTTERQLSSAGKEIPRQQRRCVRGHARFFL